MTNAGHKLLGFVLAMFKAFWSAVVQVAWGIATFFLLIGLLGYFKVDPSALTTLFKLVEFVQKNWGLFFIVIFLWEFITNYKEFLRPIMKEEMIVETGKVKL